MNNKSRYKDLEKWRKGCRRYKKKYYGRFAKPRSEWAAWQDELVLAHTMPDRDLSELIGHGVMAIQIRRSRLRKGLEESEALR